MKCNSLTYILIFVLTFTGLITVAQVRPDQFPEELNPTNENTEFYSQFNGTNTRVRLGNLKKYFTPNANLIPIIYIPTTTGNASNRMEFVKDPNGDVWFIDASGDGLKLQQEVEIVATDLSLDGDSLKIVGGSGVSLSGFRLTQDEIRSFGHWQRTTSGILVYSQGNLLLSGQADPYFEIKSNGAGFVNQVVVRYSSSGEGMFDIGLDNDGIDAFCIGGPNLSNKYLTIFRSGDVSVLKDGYFNGSTIFGDNKDMLDFNDSFLRLNNSGHFVNGIYCGNSTLRTDGQIELGPNGSKFRVEKVGGDIYGNGKMMLRSTSSVLQLNPIRAFSGGVSLKGQFVIKESDSEIDAVRITRDNDEGFVQLMHSGTQKVQIRSNGNSYLMGSLGLGIENPYNKLDVVGNVSTPNSFIVRHPSTGEKIGDIKSESSTRNAIMISADPDGLKDNSDVNIYVDGLKKISVKEDRTDLHNLLRCYNKIEANTDLDVGGIIALGTKIKDSQNNTGNNGDILTKVSDTSVEWKSPSQQIPIPGWKFDDTKTGLSWNSGSSSYTFVYSESYTVTADDIGKKIVSAAHRMKTHTAGKGVQFTIVTRDVLGTETVLATFMYANTGEYIKKDFTTAPALVEGDMIYVRVTALGTDTGLEVTGYSCTLTVE